MLLSHDVCNVVELELFSRILAVSTQIDCLGLYQSVFAEFGAV